MNIDPMVVKQVFSELEALESDEFLFFKYDGDNTSSIAEMNKHRMIEMLIDGDYVHGKFLRGLGSTNAGEFNVRLTNRGYELLNEYKNQHKW